MSPLPQGRLPGRCRVAVVGGGLAGLELAKELVDTGCEDVLVLEAGPADELRHTNVALPADAALRRWLQPDTDPYFRRTWRSENPPHYGAGSGVRSRLGGRSLYWYGVVLPLETWALGDRWPVEVVDDLVRNWRDDRGLYRRVQDDLAAWAAEDGFVSPLGLTTRVGPVAGLDLAVTPSALRSRPGKSDRWHAYSPLDRWRDPETGTPREQRSGLHVATGTEVVQVVIDGDRARGVQVRRSGSGPESVEAEAVVLAAGTLESSRLAIQALARTTRPQLATLSGLTDHLVQGYLVRLDGAAAGRLRDLVPDGNYFAPCARELRSNLFVEVVSSPDGACLIDVRTIGEQLPSRHNVVRCRTAGSMPWAMSVRSGLSDADRDLIAGQRALLQQTCDELLAGAGCRPARLDFGRFDRPDRTNSAVLPEAIRGTAPAVPVTWSSHLGTEDHEGGTLPIGSVLTSDQEFASVAGLYAVGPATFSRPGAANPSLTTLALARRLAGHLTRRYGVPDGPATPPAT